jgi:hypothetical protein
MQTSGGDAFAYVPEGFVELGKTAGLRHDRAVRLASGDLAHVFHPSGR